MSIPVEIVGRSQDLTDWIVVGAAVVQALGSIGAILGAVWLTNHDRAETAREGRSQQISAVASIIFKADGTLRNVFDAIAADPLTAWQAQFAAEPWERTQRAILQCLNIMRAMPLHSFDWELASAVMEADEALVTGNSALHRIKAVHNYDGFSNAAHPVDPEPLREPLNLAARAVARVGQAAHSNSSNRRSRKYRITAQEV